MGRSSQVSWLSPLITKVLTGRVEGQGRRGDGRHGCQKEETALLVLLEEGPGAKERAASGNWKREGNGSFPLEP